MILSERIHVEEDSWTLVKTELLRLKDSLHHGDS